ncbi:MAG: MOSC domain-containing protein [Candidatus Hydrogenedentes bacterium]|nr:MOSC domain-containing protein [Candidatus Hydrogenedentota bacterium]
MGRLEAICISERRGIQKRALRYGELIVNQGLEGDAHSGPWHRQLSLLDYSDIEWMRSKGLQNLEPGAFGENLVIAGINLASLGLGSRIRVGATAELTVTQRGKVCHNRCEIFYKAGDCIMPTRGVFVRIRTGGSVVVGDPVDVLETISPQLFQVVVLTVSDKGSRGERIDTAGPAVAQQLRDQLPSHIYTNEIVSDDQEQIEDRLKHYASGHGIDLVVAVGGTGFSPRDVTPEAVCAVVERLTPGLDEAMRRASFERTHHAMLSRATSGILGQTLILSLPGSERSAIENLNAILPALPHGLQKLRGDTTDCGPRLTNVTADPTPVAAL